MMLAGEGRAEQAGIMQGSSLSFAAEGWLLLICCSSVICRGKQTPRIVFRDLSQPCQVEASRPSPPPTQGGNTRTPCLRHWAYSGTSALQATEVPGGWESHARCGAFLALHSSEPFSSLSENPDVQ